MQPQQSAVTDAPVCADRDLLSRVMDTINILVARNEILRGHAQHYKKRVRELKKCVRELKGVYRRDLEQIAKEIAQDNNDLRRKLAEVEMDLTQALADKNARERELNRWRTSTTAESFKELLDQKIEAEKATAAANEKTKQLNDQIKDLQEQLQKTNRIAVDLAKFCDAAEEQMEYITEHPRTRSISDRLGHWLNSFRPYLADLDRLAQQAQEAPK